MYFSAEKQQTYICLWYLLALHNRSHLRHTGPVNKGKHEKTNVWEDEFWIGSCTSKVPLRRKDSLKNFFFFSFLLFLLWASLLRWKGSQLASSFSFHFLCYFYTIFLLVSPAALSPPVMTLFWLHIIVTLSLELIPGSPDSHIFTSSSGYTFLPFDCQPLT